MIPVFLAFLGLSVSSMMLETLTHDEASFYEYGRQLWEKKTAVRLESFHNSKMPVNALQALPQLLAEKTGLARDIVWGGKTLAYDEYRWWLSRFVTVLFGLLTLIIVARWSCELYGAKGALFSAFLAGFCPTMLGHSHYITTDIPTAALMTLAMFTFWHFCAKPSAKTFVFSAFSLGLAQLAKYTAGILFPICAVAGFFARARILSWCRNKKALLALCIAGFALIALLIINTGFLWESPMKPIKDYGMGTEAMKSLPSFMQKIPLPTACGYFQGLALTLGYERHLAQSPGRPYFLGETAYRRWWLYYPVALLLKMPLAFWFLLLIAFSRGHVSKDERLFLLFPATIIFFYFACFQRLQIGIRFLLPVLPLLYVFLGRLVTSGDAGHSKALRRTTYFLTIWFAVSSVSYFPHFVSHFNEGIGPRLNAYRYLADSNLDWGQSGKDLNRYLAAHAQEKIAVNPKTPVSGKIIVSVNHLVGIYDPEQFRWLREHHRPIGHIGYAWLIYDI